MIGLLLNSWWNLVLVALFSAFIYFIIWLRKRLRYFEERNVAHVKFSLFSIIKGLIQGTNVVDAVSRIYFRYPDERYVGFYSGLTPTYMIRDPDLTGKITKSAFSHFHDRVLFGTSQSEEGLETSLVFLVGDKWKTLRMKLMPAFTTGKLKWMSPLMESCSSSLVQHIKKNITDPEEDVEAPKLFAIYCLGSLVSCGFGIEPDCVKDPECEFRKKLEKSTTGSVFQMLLVSLRILLPDVFRMLKLRVTARDVEDYFVGLLKTEMERRLSQGVKRSDMVQLLMEIKEKGELTREEGKLEWEEVYSSSSSGNIEFTDAVLATQMLLFFHAGFQNCTQVMALVSYYLSKHPDIQDRVREEIREAKSKHGSINYAALSDMKLLAACVDESLRLEPPTGLMIRECTENYTLDDGFVIEKGTKIVVPSLPLQMDPNYWQNPERFDPDRFLNKGDIRPGIYFPFGDGPRICIGQRFSLLQVRMIMAKVVENFQLLPSNKTQEPFKHMPLFNFGIIGGLWIRLKAIQHSTA